SGLSLINYCGHGSSNSWGTSGFSSSDVNDLRNGDMLPVIISVACVNGTFHKGTCFAEAWLRKQDGGAVAALMATINQPWTPPMRGQDYMNDLLIGGYDYQVNPGNGTSTAAGRTIFGSIVLNGLVLMYAESNGSHDLDTLSTWTIFGDASLQVRTQPPLQIEISNIEVTAGDRFSTNISDGAEAVSGAMVVLSQNDMIFKGITSDSGDVTIEHELEAGAATLVVSGSNLATIYQEIQVEN
ncbi:MAG: hypothetical protein GY874_14985, partial [Desulfobacteraceae bacterium]|nr:hypothetical protein [Desulfobacteraceae bacterium]